MWTHEQGQDVTGIQDWLGHVSQAPENDSDMCTMVSGPEGNGKSTLWFLLVHTLDPDFDLERCTFTGPDFIRACNNTRMKPVVLDEGIEGAFSRDAMIRELNVALVKFLQVCRERNNLMFLTIPNYRWFDPYIRDSRAHWHLYVGEKGVVDIDYPLRGKHQSETYWHHARRVPFPPVSGRRWDAYLKYKRDYAEQTGRNFGTVVKTLAERRTELADQIRAEMRPWAQRMAAEAKTLPGAEPKRKQRL